MSHQAPDGGVIRIETGRLVWSEAPRRATAIRLRRDPVWGGAAHLLKIEASADGPWNAAAGEELFVVEGRCDVGGAPLDAGDYHHAPVGGPLRLSTQTGALLLSVAHGQKQSASTSPPAGPTPAIAANAVEWRPSKHAGVEYKTFRFDKATGGGTVLLRMAPGCRYPAHRHTEGEDVFILDGELIVGADRIPSRGYLYSPPGSVHAPRTEAGCTLIAFFPAEVIDL